MYVGSVLTGVAVYIQTYLYLTQVFGTVHVFSSTSVCLLSNGGFTSALFVSIGTHSCYNLFISPLRQVQRGREKEN